MSLKNLDPSQNKAVRELDKHLYVTASAGTGKTEVLSRRFIHILDVTRAKISEILAITFSEKAANEMKERIFQQINTKIKEEKGDNYWKKVKKEFRHGEISTIHSFCASLIREHFIELGIDPEYEIVDEAELKFEIMKWVKNTIIKGIDRSGGELYPGHKECLVLMREFSFVELRNILTELFLNRFKVEKKIIPLFKKLDEKAKYFDAVTNFIENEKKDRVSRVKELNAMGEFLGFLNDLDLDKSQNCPFSKYVALVAEIMESLNNGEIHEDSLALYRDVKFGKEDKKIWSQEEFDGFFRMLSPIKWWLPEILFEEISPEGMRKTYTSTVMLLSLYEIMVSEMKESVGESKTLYDWLNGKLLTFDDLQILALDLLNEERDLDDEGLSPVLKELRGKYNYIMVDESQDIDEAQKEIISRLTDFNNGKPRLFVVGDSKQSIYKFRGADLSGFKELTGRIDLSETGGYHLGVNYRSQAGLVEFVNEVFQVLMAEEGESYEVRYSEPVKAFREGGDVSVELLLHNDSKAKEAMNIAYRIVDIVNNGLGAESYSYKDIAILFRSLTDLAEYEKGLDDMGIPYQVVASRGFYELREIKDCLSLLQAIHDPEDMLSLCAVMRSPFCGVSDEDLFWLVHEDEDRVFSLSQGIKRSADNEMLGERVKVRIEALEKLLKSLRVMKDRVTIAELLDQALEETMYIPVMLSHANGELVEANVALFLSRIRALEAKKAWSLTEFLDYIQILIENDQAEERGHTDSHQDKVSIMTIHKAKGAEFPVVIVPNIDRRISAGQRPEIFYHNDLGLGLKFYSPADRKRTGSYIHKYLSVEEQKKDVAESKRLFYVAVTRARNYLILSGKGSLTKNCSLFDSRARWIDYLILSLGDKAESMVDFINEGRQEEPDSIKQKTFQLALTKLLMSWNYPEPAEAPSPQSLSHRDFDLDLSLKYLRYKSNPVLDFLSATAILSYEKCPRKFYYQYIQKIKENREGLFPRKAGGEPVEELSPEENHKWPRDLPINLVGNLVHSILEKYQSGKADLEQIIINHLNEQKLSNLAPATHRDKVKQRIEELLERFMSSDTFRDMERADKDHPDHSFSEFSFIYQLGSTRLQGSVDRIYRDSRGETAIIDYKTNKYPSPKEFKKRLKTELSKYRHQMEVYRLATSEILTDVSKSELYFLDVNEKADPCSPALRNQDTESMLLKTIDEISSALGFVGSSGFSTRPERDNCKICGYHMCEDKM